MNFVDELDDLLGIDESDPTQRLAVHLAEQDERLIEQLIEHRKARGLKQKDVAAIIGRNPSVVSTFESLGSDPRLSTIRRYALAVGVSIDHRVDDAEYGARGDRLQVDFKPSTPARVYYTQSSSREDKSGRDGWDKVANLLKDSCL